MSPSHHSIANQALALHPDDVHRSTVPIQAPPLRRSSYASVISDLSDLDYMSNAHDGGRLMRTVSNASNFSAYSNAGPTTLRQKLQTLYYQNYGAFLVLMSQVFGSGMNISARLLEQPGAHGDPMHPFQILFTRQALTSLLCTAYALTTKSVPHFPLGPPDRKVRLLLVCRGLGGFFGVFGMYFSLLYLPLSEATVLTFLAPVLTCYLCSFLLPGETFTRQQQIASFVSLIGVIFIAQPVNFFASSSASSASPGTDGNTSPSNTSRDTGHDPTQPTPAQHLLAVGIAMVGVTGSVIAITCIRSIGTRAHALISINYFSVWSVIVSVLALLLIPDVSFRLPGNLIEWSLLISLGLCGFIMQSLLTMGLSYGGPANSNEPKTSPSTTSISNTQMTIATKATQHDIEMQSRPIPSASTSTLPTPHRKTKTRPSGNRATSMIYTQMLFALIADKVIFDTTVGIWSWLGIGLILSGAVWVAAAKDGNKKNDNTAINTDTNTGTNEHAPNPRLDRHRGSQTGSINGSGSGSRTARGKSEEAVGLLNNDDNITSDSEEDSTTTTTNNNSNSSSDNDPSPSSSSPHLPSPRSPIRH